MKTLKDPRENPEVWTKLPKECPVDGAYIVRWLDFGTWVDDYVRIEGGKCVATQLGLGRVDAAPTWGEFLASYYELETTRIYGHLGVPE